MMMTGLRLRTAKRVAPLAAALLLALPLGCGGSGTTEGGDPADAAADEGGSPDASAPEGGIDAGTMDSSTPEGGIDAGTMDSSAPEGGIRDGGDPDGGPHDGGPHDGGPHDGGAHDATVADAASDAGPGEDAGDPERDAGRPADGSVSDGATTDGGTCGMLGQSCEEASECGEGLTCDPAGDGICLPEDRPPDCGGVAGLTCPASAPECLYCAGCDFGPCLTVAQAECVCSTPTGREAFPDCSDD